MDASKLLRKPIKDTTWVDMSSIKYVDSPDDKYKIALSHFQEVRMGWYEGLFTLIDNHDNIIDKFDPILAVSSNLCCWSIDSTCFAIAVKIATSTYGYLIVKTRDLHFSFIKMSDPFPWDISFNNNVFTISCNDSYVEVSNSTQTFRGGNLEIPSKQYFKPDSIRLNIDELTFYPRLQLNNLAKITETDREYNLKLIDGGFKQFMGIFPINTTQVYNTRQLEVYQLEAFAEYGDKKAQEWLELIKQKTKNNYNRWTKVFDYIGFLER